MRISSGYFASDDLIVADEDSEEEEMGFEETAKQSVVEKKKTPAAKTLGAKVMDFTKQLSSSLEKVKVIF